MKLCHTAATRLQINSVPATLTVKIYKVFTCQLWGTCWAVAMVKRSSRQAEGRSIFPHFLLLIAALTDRRTRRISDSLTFLESSMERNICSLTPAEGTGWGHHRQANVKSSKLDGWKTALDKWQKSLKLNLENKSHNLDVNKTRSDSQEDPASCWMFEEPDCKEIRRRTFQAVTCRSWHCPLLWWEEVRGLPARRTFTIICSRRCWREEDACYQGDEVCKFMHHSSLQRLGQCSSAHARCLDLFFRSLEHRVVRIHLLFFLAASSLWNTHGDTGTFLTSLPHPPL